MKKNVCKRIIEKDSSTATLMLATTGGPLRRSPVSMSLTIFPVTVITGWNVTTTNFQQSLSNGKPVGSPSITGNSTTFTPNPFGGGTVAPSPLTWTGIINKSFVVPQNTIQPYPTRLK